MNDVLSHSAHLDLYEPIETSLFSSELDCVCFEQ